MTPVFGSRRRADELDLLLSRSSVHPRPSGDAAGASGPDARYHDLLTVVSALRATPVVSPRAEFSASLRERLVLAAETVLAPDSAEQLAARRAPAVRRSPRERRLAAAVGGFAIVGATASMAVAAQSALPGDTLYPLKRALENAQTGVQQGADGKGSTMLGNAAGRLDEVGALSSPGNDDAGDADAIATTLQDFVEQASEASELLLDDFAATGQASSIEELRAFTADSMSALTDLQSVIPDEARASLIRATQVVNAIDAQAQRLCPTCTDLPLIEAPPFATQAAETLLDDALTPVVVAPVRPAAKTPAADRPAKPAGGSRGEASSPRGAKTPGASPAPADPAPAPPEQEQPAPPQLPQGSDDEGGGSVDEEQTGGGLLDELNVKGSPDPIGDLLTGTTDVVDKAAGDAARDVVDGLGRLGK